LSTATATTTDKTAAAPAAPAADPNELAYAEVMQRVYEPVFFAKLAEFGVVPGSEREALQMLRMGGQLYGQYQQGLMKEAAAQGSFIDYAASRLDQLTGSSGGAEDTIYKQAAAQFLHDPNILLAAQTLSAAYAGGNN
jgi:hypothetical protein